MSPHLSNRAWNVMAFCSDVDNGELFLFLVGIAWVFFLTFAIIKKLLRAIRIFLLAKVIPKNLKSYGEWAVVTGGSSGIGKSYAREIARRGVNVVVISNELEALKLTTAEIRAEFSIECRYIHVDFTEGTGVYEEVEREVADKDVGILVNAAGILGKAPCYFLEESEANTLAMIDLHIASVTFMTIKILPIMLRKKKGIVINISSLSSFKPLSLWSIYSSCKVFSNILTNALCWEYSDRGVEFQVITPSFINTRMTKNFKFMPRGAIYPSADDFVKSAVRTIGKTENTTGYWLHELIYFCVEFISDRPFRKCGEPAVLKQSRKEM